LKILMKSTLIMLSLLAATSAYAQAPIPAVKASLTIQAVSPQAAQWPQTLSATGSVAAWQEAVIGAEIGGQRIAQLLVEVGERVRKGQLLARLNPGTLEADLAASRAALLEAEAAAREAKQSADRVKSLQGSDALSAQSIDQAIAQDAVAQARVASARARVAADELRLSYTRITASDDGLISSRLAVEGALVQPGQELFRLQRQGRLEWRAEVPGPELSRLKTGQLVRLQASGGTPVEGRLRRIAPQIDPQTRNGLVYVDLKAAPDLRAGLFARGDFVLAETAVLTLPQTAVLLRDGFSYVFKLEKDNKVRQHKVQIGRRQGDRIEIRDGLAAGVQVAAHGVGFLADGDTVRVTK
jgi:RND family efflux transporter MFP subunit